MALGNAVVTTRAAWSDAIAAYDAASQHASAVIHDLRNRVIAAFGADSPGLGTFGFRAPERTARTSERQGGRDPQGQGHPQGPQDHEQKAKSGAPRSASPRRPERVAASGWGSTHTPLQSRDSGAEHPASASASDPGRASSFEPSGGALESPPLDVDPSRAPPSGLTTIGSSGASSPPASELAPDPKLDPPHPHPSAATPHSAGYRRDRERMR